MFAVSAVVGSSVTGGDPNVRAAAGMFGGVETTAPPDVPQGAAATPRQTALDRSCPQPMARCQSNFESQPSVMNPLLDRGRIVTDVELLTSHHVGDCAHVFGTQRTRTDHDLPSE